MSPKINTMEKEESSRPNKTRIVAETIMLYVRNHGHMNKKALLNVMYSVSDVSLTDILSELHALGFVIDGEGNIIDARRWLKVRNIKNIITNNIK